MTAALLIAGGLALVALVVFEVGSETYRLVRSIWDRIKP